MQASMLACQHAGLFPDIVCRGYSMIDILI